MRDATIYTALLALENKLDSIRSAAPEYQLSEELKVCFFCNLVPSIPYSHCID